ncbi:MAG: hypothetical protein LBJ18_00260 [Rickettsiales bacterium]|jgi:hypothetical protein|nr:hypothetical protein [Rickettsiales bacterium]
MMSARANFYIWALAVSAFIGMGRAGAQNLIQNSNDSIGRKIPPKLELLKHAPIKPFTVEPLVLEVPKIGQPANPPHPKAKSRSQSIFSKDPDDSSPHQNSNIDDLFANFEFDKMPSVAEFVARVAHIPNVQIDTVYVNSLDEFYEKLDDPNNPFIPAYFNPARDKITINLLQIKGSAIGNYHGKGSREDAIGARAKLNEAVGEYNNGAIGLFIHELKHFGNKRNISLCGKTVRQICQFPIHDELSAPMAEMLFRRDIFIKTGDIKQAMRGVSESGFRTIKRMSCFHEYFQYLKKHKEELAEIPSGEEIDVIIKLAIENFMSDINQYSVNIPKITQFKIVSVYRQYLNLDTPPDNEPMRCFDKDLYEVYYNFGNFCILDIAPPEAIAKIFGTVQKFIELRDVKKNFAEFVGAYGTTIDKHAEDFRNKNGIQDNSELDIFSHDKDISAEIALKLLQMQRE